MAYNILSRQIWRLVNERGFSYDDAKKLAYNQQKRLWRTQPWTFRLSEQWVAYSKLSPAQRALQRRAKIDWWSISDYNYLNWKVKKRWVKRVWSVE